MLAEPLLHATPEPYYDDGVVTIYNGDSREILPLLAYADAVVTDPPYGIGLGYDVHDDTTEFWFKLMDEMLPLIRAAAAFVVMPCCRIASLDWWYANHKPDWMMAWYKGSPGHRSAIGFNDWEPHLTWGKPPKAMHDYFQTPCGWDDNGHPCPKPIEWAWWLVERAVSPGGVVVDPFMGSGTTLRAAKDLGRRGIGIDLSETYCEIAAERMGQEVLIAPPAEPVAEQDSLFDA